MLTVSNIDSFYGNVQALRGISIEVGGNEIVSIIGSNGAGKSTLMKSVMGIVKPKRGEVIFDGEAINLLHTSVIVKKGIVYIPEGREVFPDMTVADNLQMGAYCRRYSVAQYHGLLDEMFEMFPVLKERRLQKAGTLSGGEQQMVAIARGMMSSPKLIMFDEPSLGLAPVIVDEVFDTIMRINKEKHIPIILVEQNAFMALTISRRCYVLENGEIKTEGLSSELINSPEIEAAYLGA